MAPHALELRHTRTQIFSPRCKNHGIDSTGRGSADDPEWVAAPTRQQLCDCLEHADLEGSAGAAARQYKRRFDVIFYYCHLMITNTYVACSEFVL